jgi:hypothetical protein
VFQNIVKKTCNARFGVEIDAYKDEFTGRRAAEKADTTQRGGLKATCNVPLA